MDMSHELSSIGRIIALYMQGAGVWTTTIPLIYLKGGISSLDYLTKKNMDLGVRDFHMLLSITSFIKFKIYLNTMFFYLKYI
jgi:hypothetical protein